MFYVFVFLYICILVYLYFCIYFVFVYCIFAYLYFIYLYICVFEGMCDVSQHTNTPLLGCLCSHAWAFVVSCAEHYSYNTYLKYAINLMSAAKMLLLIAWMTF